MMLALLYLFRNWVGMFRLGALEIKLMGRRIFGVDLQFTYAREVVGVWDIIIVF